MIQYPPPARRSNTQSSDLGEMQPLYNHMFYPLDPHIRYINFVSRIIFWGILSVLMLLFVFFGSLRATLGFPLLMMGFAGFGFFAVIHVFWPFISYRYWGYAVRETDVLIRSGVIFKRISAVPFSRIQHVDSNSGPLERSLGLANLIIYTAGSEFGSLVIPGLAIETAEGLRDYLSEVGHTHANI